MLPFPNPRRLPSWTSMTFTHANEMQRTLNVSIDISSSNIVSDTKSAIDAEIKVDNTTTHKGVASGVLFPRQRETFLENKSRMLCFIRRRTNMQ